MKKMNLPLMLFFSITILVMFPACKETAEFTSQTERSQAFLEQLPCNGFDTTGAVLGDGYAFLEKDIVVQESEQNNHLSLENILENIETEATDRQYAKASNNLIAINNVGAIKYYIDPNVSNIPNSGSDWPAAIRTAATQWTTMTQVKAAFSEVFNATQANVKFYRDDHQALNGTGLQNLPSEFVAAACMPSNSLPGQFVSISHLASINAVYGTPELRRRAMRHELGHVLGFRHNNAPNYDAQQSGTICWASTGNPIFIEGTLPNDASSIMIPEPLSGYVNYSLNDLYAARYMYPDGYNPATITSITKPGPNLVKITTSTTPSPQIPYRIVIARYAPGATSPTQTYPPYYGPTDNNLRIFNNLPCPNGTWEFRVWYLNYGVYGVGSNRKSVTVP